jgi:phage FluMu gp28-like protein
MAWVNDRSRRKITRKSRRIGYSFAEGFAKVLACLERPGTTSIVLSRGERQAKQFIEESVAPHIRALGVIAQYIDADLPGTSIHKQEVRIGDSKIIALPANPDTARSYEGDVTLDEFAFHKDARKIYEAIAPSITRGFSLSVISTPNGQQGAYYELAKEAGLVDGRASTDRWSPHSTTLIEAIAQGCLDINGNVLDAEEIRRDCMDEEMYLQEYLCQFLSTASQFIPPELFEANVSDEASAQRPSLEARNLFCGWDVARHKDLSVLWFLELVGDVTVTRGIVEFSKEPTPNQIREARAFMSQCRRMCIDKTGMGLAIFEAVEEKFSGQVEGIIFTITNKELMAVHAKRRMEARKTRIPDTDMIRNSFRSVKKTVTATGQARFDAEHDAKYGHADHWWAYCLAEHAAGAPSVLGVVEYGKREQEAVNKLKQSVLQKPATNDQTEACPKCQSTHIQRVGGQKRCADCGEQFGGVKTVLSDKLPGARGRELIK